MTLRKITFVIGAAFTAGVSQGQTSTADVKAEEMAIRSVIGAGKRAPYTDDRVLWTGALKRPVMGQQQADAFPEANLGKRKNQKSTTKVERLEVAASGDMAWEYSVGTLEYDVDETPSSHVKFETGGLRVWKKEKGQWKVAAVFMRPLDVPFVPH